MTEDPQLVHAREFTDLEDVTLDVWLDLEDLDQDELAAQVLDAGLMFEHYTSLLPPLQKDRTDAQLRNQAKLREAWQRLVEQGRQLIRDLKGGVSPAAPNPAGSSPPDQS